MRYQSLKPELVFSALLIMAVAAFYPVYFAVIEQVLLPVHLHTMAAILWLLTMALQSRFAIQKNFRLHKLFGKTTYFSATFFVITSLWVFHGFLQRDTPFEQAFAVQFSFYEMLGLLYFSVAYTLAVTYFKKHTAIHARLMLTTITLMLFPVIARLLLFYSPVKMDPTSIFNLSLIMIDILLLAVICIDKFKGGKYQVFVILFLCVLIQHIGYYYCNHWVWWLEFCDWYASLGPKV